MVIALLAMLAVGFPRAAGSQDARIRDLTVGDQAVPVRLMGYGLVVGLDGTGDRGIGARTSGHTVQSVANLLRRFGIEVPIEYLRTRNVAAVLVTAEVSPYLRPGGRFEVQVASLGDARSLRGGVLWMTPLVADVGGEAMAAAQGTLLLSEGAGDRRAAAYAVETSARIPAGGVLEQDLPRPAFASAATRLVLREPDLGTATRIADAVNAAGLGVSARVEDPGAVAIAFPPADTARAATLARLGELRVRPDRAPRLVIDGRDGTVVAGGDLTVGEAVVSHAGLTLAIDAPGASSGAPAPGAPASGAAPRAAPPVTARAGEDGAVTVPAGTPVQQVAAALHAARATPTEIAAIFAALRDVGALAAEVVVR
jgi:flagellar P-ring protein precursor FlgI